MLFRILKKDLKRKKTMNMILFLFIVLATMFVASGINNMVTVMNGTDYYLDRAGVGDYIIITMGEGAVGALDEMLETEPAVLDYRLERVVFGAQDNVTAADGHKIETKNTTIFQSIGDSAITFFDTDNQEIETVEKGHVYVSGSFMDENGFQEGDIICIEHNGVEMSLVLDGKVKDALLGSDFMGNTRFVLNDADMQTLLGNDVLNDPYQGEICYIDTDDVGAMASAMSKVDANVAFDGSRSTIKMCYVMDMIVAFIMLLLSICLIIVSFVVLKFSITFTISEEFREIGVMKAIGIRNPKIRSLYIIKYLMMAVIGAVIGFFASIPFGNLLLQSVSENMVLGNDNAILVNLFGSVLVVCVIVLFAYFCTGKVKKSTPLDAIRSGQTGERYKKKTILRIQKSHSSTTWYMALNDILSNPKRFFTIMISFSICTLFVLVLVNTTATMKSPNLIHTFGTESDLYVTDVADLMKHMAGTKEEMEAYLDEKGAELEELGMPAEFCIELQYKYTVSFEGNDYVLTCQQGLGTEISDYVYTEGVVPQNKNEIAITPLISEITGAKIGDTVIIHYGDGDMECMVTAYFQTMNQLGEVVRLHEDAPTDFRYISSGMAYQIDFTDEPSQEEIEVRKDRIKELYDNDKVMNATEYCMDCVAVADTMESVQFLLLSITLVVVVLVTILMERTFIADEKSQIAILKAIGFKDRAVIKWHVYRFGLVALISVIIAACVSIPMTDLCITPIFGMMGATDIDYNIDPLQIFVIYPGIVFVVTILVAWITAMHTKAIKSSDTANIE